MNAKRTYFVLIALVALSFVVLVAGAYGTNSLLAERSSSITALRAKVQAQAQEQVSLVKAKADIAKYSSLEQVTNQIVPQDKNQAEAVREINTIAGNNGIRLTTISFSSSTLGSSAVPVASSTTTTPSPTPAAAANPDSKSNLLSQLQPVKTIPGVYILPITVQSDATAPVPYSSFIAFLATLENNRRTSQVTNIAIQPDIKNHSLVSFNLDLNEYIKP